MTKEFLDEINAALAAGTAPFEEIVTAIGTAFPLAQWRGGQEVAYRSPDGSVALRLIYTRSGEIHASAGESLSREVADALTKRVRALQSEGEPSVWRAILFSSLPVQGYWRYHDDWQLLPVPSDAPRPEFLMAHHPFLLEIRDRSTGDFVTDGVRARRRLWELELILALALRWSVSSEPSSTEHVWVLGEPPTHAPVYRQRGYFIPNFDAPKAELSKTTGLKRVTEVPVRDYYADRGFYSDSEFDVPNLLALIFDQYNATTPAMRERLLRAAYWLSRGRLIWRASTSASYIAVINALEVLLDDPPRDDCPTCGLNRAPGRTALFRALVERYAGTVEGHTKLYQLRSKLVHGGEILDADRPTAWADFVPSSLEERNQEDLARRVAQAVIINWFLANRPS